MLTHVQQCTKAEAHRVKNSDEWKLSLSKLKAFISLLYVRGALCEKNRPILKFWDKIWRVSFFPQTMDKNRFCEILRFIRFDMRITRLSPFQTDKFVLFLLSGIGLLKVYCLLQTRRKYYSERTVIPN